LHAIARVTSESDDDLGKFLEWELSRCCIGHGPSRGMVVVRNRTLYALRAKYSLKPMEFIETS
tara:strand:- start:197 stop:385 length:189 start_codon:yes stop_codon:yes gene_type:complete